MALYGPLWLVSSLVLLGTHSAATLDAPKLPAGLDVESLKESIKALESDRGQNPTLTAEQLAEAQALVHKVKELKTNGHKLPDGFDQKKYERVAKQHGAQLPVPQSSLSDGNGQFAVKLYQALSATLAPQENLIFSPLSIELALTKLYLGAGGDTATQITDTLSFPQHDHTDEIVHQFQTVLSELQSSKELNNIYLDTQIFTDTNVRVLETFQAKMEEHFDKVTESIDFRDADSVKLISDWLAKSTEEKLKDVELFSLDDVRVLLADVLYMQPFWDKPFQTKNTRDGDFTLENGEEICVPMMYQENRFYYGFIKDHDVPFIELPLVNRKMSMFVFLLPVSGEKPSLEEHLKTEYLTNTKQVFRVLPVELNTHLRMPTFRIQQSAGILDTLNKLGITNLFSAEADLSGISGTDGLFVSDVIHTAAMRVDESGTNKPSKSIDNLDMAQKQTKDVEFTVDRPFIFVVKENTSNTIVLMGKIQDPSNLAIHSQDVDKEEL